MTSYPSNLEPDQLTTEQLLAAAAREAGYAPSWRQLRYWVHAGLLPTPQQKALGRGKGSTTLWDAEALPRLLLILHARTGATSRNIALDSALLLLVLKGYAPMGTDRLQETLADYLTAWDEAIARQQDGAHRLLGLLKHPHRRLARELEAMPDTGGRLFQSIVALMLPDASASNPLQRLGYYLSPTGMREALDATDEAQLRATYAHVGTLLGEGLADANFSGLPLPPMTQATAIPPRLLARVPEGVRLSEADLRRIPLTLTFIAWLHYDQQLTEAWAAAGRHMASAAHNSRNDSNRQATATA